MADVDREIKQQPGAPRISQAAFRVLMIAPTSFFADYGCHVRILEETRALQAKGCQVTICTYRTGNDVPGVPTLRTAPIPWRRDWEVGSSWHKIGYDILLFLRAFAAMFTTKPQVIHAHLHEGALIGLVLSRLWRIPMVFDFQGSLVNEMTDHKFIRPDSKAYRFFYRLERLIDHSSHSIITSSDNAANILVEEFGCSYSQITCVPDCVSTSHFQPITDEVVLSRMRHKWGVPGGRKIVVYLGLLARYQGIPELLEAAARILQTRQDVHFLIAGYPNVEMYRDVATQMGIREHVTFTGRVPYQEAPQLLAVGDIAVLPKLSKTEGAGKLLNYMSMRLPTVAFDTPVSHEYLDEFGVYAALGDSTSLAEKLLWLLDDPEKRQQLGDALRQRAIDHYSWERAGNLIFNTYTYLCKPRKAS